MINTEGWTTKLAHWVVKHAKPR